MWGHVNGFILNYPDMKNKHVDYTKHKILRELDFMKAGFICVKWSNTTRNGTKATFAKATNEEIEERLKELKLQLEE